MAVGSLVLGACARGDELEEPLDVAAPGAPDGSALYAGIPQEGDALGAAAAPLTLTDLSDLRCPHCSTFVVQVVPILVEKYVRRGQLRLVFGDFPILGPQSLRAARVAAAAGMQNHLWEFVDVFLHNQRRLGWGNVTDGFIRELAVNVPGMDADRALVDSDSAVVTERLAEVSRFAGQLGVRSTPTFLLGKTGAEPTVVRLRPSEPEASIQAIDALLVAR